MPVLLLQLKVTGSSPFSPFTERNPLANAVVESEQDLQQAWKVMTKVSHILMTCFLCFLCFLLIFDSLFPYLVQVKGALENGSRLENLSWRLWHRQSIAKSSFKKLSIQATLDLDVPCLARREGSVESDMSESVNSTPKRYAEPLDNNVFDEKSGAVQKNENQDDALVVGDNDSFLVDPRAPVASRRPCRLVHGSI